MANGNQFNNDVVEDWNRSLQILHRGHWNAASRYDKINFTLGIIATIMATISSTGAFSGQVPASIRLVIQIVTGLFGLFTAVIIAVQTYYRSSELAAKHKKAAVQFGQLRRELEENLDLGLPADYETRKQLLTSFRERWSAVDEASPAVVDQIYQRAKIETEQKLKMQSQNIENAKTVTPVP